MTPTVCNITNKSQTGAGFVLFVVVVGFVLFCFICFLFVFVFVVFLGYSLSFI